jgi:membrane-associated protease RseP (regulator of RpoE activity)
MQIQTLLLIAPPILLALTFHEYAHAYVAYRHGDDTAKQSGRLTLNPLRHLDPLGTIMIFLVHFGWAKPVPVNPYQLRNPKKDMLWISAAGPLANMVLALISGILIRLVFVFGGAPERHSVADCASGWLKNFIRTFTGQVCRQNLLPGALRSFYSHRINHIRARYRCVHSGWINLAVCKIFQQTLCGNIR